jgi:precorrin-3B synthase
LRPRRGGIMSAVAVRGWCPGALQPMQSGDGLVLRVRPYGGRLDAKQSSGVAELSELYGNGLIDLTRRANLQIRGVSKKGHLPLLEGLARLNLLDDSPRIELRRNILVTPFWHTDDETCSLAEELEQALSKSSLNLPAKFGFAVDDGPDRVLAGASADIRIERDCTGELLVRADGAELGRPVARKEAIALVLALAEWFVASGGASDGGRRMAAHLQAVKRLPEALRGNREPAKDLAPPSPGIYPQGAMVGVALGQLQSSTLCEIAGYGRAIRMTPWRMILVEGMREMPLVEHLITRADDPALRIIACSGAPRCSEAHADTRMLATMLAPHITADERLHVSGCPKGCAHSGSASLTLIATGGGFDLVRDGSTRDVPVQCGLSVDAILSNLSVLLGQR